MSSDELEAGDVLLDELTVDEELSCTRWYVVTPGDGRIDRGEGEYVSLRLPLAWYESAAREKLE